MKLYGNIKSERAEKGQGGNEFLEIEITNDKRLEVVFIKIVPGDKIKVSIDVNKDLAELEIGRDFECKCVDPLCAKCLLVNCKDSSCKIHPEDKKREFRELYKNR